MNNSETAETTQASEEVAVETAEQAANETIFEVAEWLPDSILPFWESMVQYPWLLTAGLIITGYLVSKLVQWIFVHGLAGIAAKTRSDLDDRLIALLSKPVFSTVFYLTMMFVVAALALPASWNGPIMRILLCFILFSWSTAALKGIRLVLDMLAHVKHRFDIIEARTIPLFDIIFKLLTFGLATYLFFLIWDIDATAWLASAGVIGIAVGFAAKDTLANLFSGIFIVADAPYKIGDFIVLDTGERGQVTHVGMRSTRILSRDDIEITVPNAVIANAKIINESGGPWEKQRIRIKVGVAYGTDLDLVCEELMAIATDNPHIIRSPEPRVRLRMFGASSVDFELLCWIDEPVLRGRLSHALYMAIYKRFNEAGIEIPYQQVDVHLKGDAATAQE